MADSQRDWSGLPKDLLILIRSSLGPGTIFHRLLRAVCPAWRSALPLAGDDDRDRPLHPSLLQIPLFFDYSGDPLEESPDLPPHDVPQGKITLLVSSDEPDQKWIIQVHQTGPGKLSLFNPLTGSKLQFPPGMKLDQINLLDFRITDLGTSLSLLGTNMLARNYGFLVSPLKKMIALYLVPGSFVLVALSNNERLHFWEPGLEKWSEYRPNEEFGDSDNFSGRIKDIVSYKELLYAVDKDGRLLMFDPLSWREPVIVVCRPLIENEEEEVVYYVYMRLVLSKGSLYLVVRIEGWHSYVRVYVLKEENGEESRWDEVKSIGDRVFFIGWDSNFSISSSDHGWNVKDCIYFGGNMGKSTELDLEYGSGAGIYDLGSSHFVKFECWADYGVHARLFWPPPRWIAPDANLDPDMDPYEWLHELRRLEIEKTTHEYLKDIDDPGLLLEMFKDISINTSLLEALQNMDD